MPTPKATIVCTQCLNHGKAEPILEFHPSQDQVICRDCGSVYRVVTRVVVQMQAGYANGVRFRYVLKTREADGRLRTRRLDGPNNIVLRPGDLVTLVWYRDKPVGIANQSKNVWSHLYVPLNHTGPQRIALTLTGVSGALALLYALLNINIQSGDWLKYTAAALCIAVIMTSLVLAPWLLQYSQRPVEQDDRGWAKD